MVEWLGNWPCTVSLLCYCISSVFYYRLRGVFGSWLLVKVSLFQHLLHTAEMSFFISDLVTPHKWVDDDATKKRNGYRSLSHFLRAIIRSFLKLTKSMPIFSSERSMEWRRQGQNSVQHFTRRAKG